jgi:hypothetical protein
MVFQKSGQFLIIIIIFNFVNQIIFSKYLLYLTLIKVDCGLSTINQLRTDESTLPFSKLFNEEA